MLVGPDINVFFPLQTCPLPPSFTSSNHKPGKISCLCATCASLAIANTAVIIMFIRSVPHFKGQWFLHLSTLNVNQSLLWIGKF